MRGYGKRKSKLLVFLLLLCMSAGCSKADTSDEKTEAATGEKTENVTEEALAPEKPEGKNDADVEALQKIIEEQNASGADMPVDLNDEAYMWDEKGRLTELMIANCKLQGAFSCEGLPSLRKLDCSHNQLSSLDVSNNIELDYLNCNHNELSSLNVSDNIALQHLVCGWNDLSSLDVSNNTGLTKLNCAYNELSSLDVSQNTQLEILSCDENELSSLDVSQNTQLKSLSCGNNELDRKSVV